MADDDGLLPPWTRWWPEEDLAVVLPDAVVVDLAGRLGVGAFRSAPGREGTTTA